MKEMQIYLFIHLTLVPHKRNNKQFIKKQEAE